MSVVGLDGQPAKIELDYNTEVTSLLERALADAKEFNVNGVAVVLITPKNDGSFDADIYWHGRRLTLLAGACRLTHRLNERCDEAMELIS